MTYHVETRTQEQDGSWVLSYTCGHDHRSAKAAAGCAADLRRAALPGTHRLTAVLPIGRLPEPPAEGTTVDPYLRQTPFWIP
jgi:hypothetical protein